MTTSEAERSAMDMAMVLMSITNFALPAAVLGPFVIIYQILAGSWYWWVALLAPSVFVPCFMNCIHEALLSPCPRRTSILFMGFFYVGLACSAMGLLLWWMSEAVIGDFLRVSAWFTLSLFGCTALVTATGARMCFDMQAAKSVHCLWDPIVKIVRPVMAKVDYFGIIEKGHVACDVMSMVAERAGMQHGLGCVTAWIWWGLKIDALATFFYHLTKAIWLGFKTHCFQQWLLIPEALTLKFSQNEKQMVQFLKEEQKPMVPEEELQWPLEVMGVVFFTACILAVVTNRAYEVKNKRDRIAKCCLSVWEAFMRCRRCRLSDPESVDESVSESEADELLSSQDKPSCEPMREPESDRVVQRQEFILVGLLHWCLVVLRQKIWRQGVPHNFDFAGVRFGGMSMDKRTTAKFHDSLMDDYKLKLPADEKTIFDSAYMSMDSFMCWAHAAECCALFSLVLAANFQLRGQKRQSVRCVMCACLDLGLPSCLFCRNT